MQPKTLFRIVPSALALSLSIALAACSGGGGGDGGGGGSSPAATNPTPASGASAVATNVQLTWSAAAGAVGYEIFLGENAALGAEDMIVSTTGTDTSTPGLDPATTYFWRVDALDGAGGRVPSEVFNFTTAVPLDDSILTFSAAGTISINGGPALPITSSFYAGFGTADTVTCDIGAYYCTPSLTPWPEDYGIMDILIDGNNVPTGDINIRLADSPGIPRTVSGLNVDFDGGRRYSASGTATASGETDVSFSFSIVADVETSTFELDGATAHLNGCIGATTPMQMQVLADGHPEIDTIEFGCIFGSLNDTANLQAGQIMRAAGFKSRAVADTDIASGGVDLFTAGVARTIENGATFRVHAWGDGSGSSATDFQPCPGHPAHQSFVSYLNQMMGAPLGEQFYCFTINACEPGCTVIMTPAEIAMFGLATQ